MANVTSEMRKGFEAQVIAKALADETFRKALISSPRAAVEGELGIKLPGALNLRVVEESADSFYLVLPQKNAGAQAGELSDVELEAVAGGKTPSTETKKAPIERNDASQFRELER
jgi:hypothetical protein